MGACEACPTASTSAVGTASLLGCECMEGYYTLWHGANLSCEACPIGANCTAPGLTFERLPPRATGVPTHDHRRPPLPRQSGSSACEGCGGDGCQRTNYTGCRNGTGGACGACAESAGPNVYYDQPQRLSPVSSGKPCANDRAGQRTGRHVSLAVAFAVVRRARERRTREQQLDSAAAARPGRAKRVLMTLKRRLKIKLKIAFSFYQVATKVGETYMVVYPESVETTLEFLSFVNLELDGLGVPLACVSLGSFRAKLLFLMLAPLGVLLLFKGVGWVRHDRADVRRELDRISSTTESSASTSRRSSRASTSVSRSSTRRTRRCR